MPTNHHTNSLEELLKQQADEFRMIPSQKTWRAIHKKTVGSRRFPSFTAVAIFITVLFSARPLGTKHSDKVSHISAVPTSKKAAQVHKV
jgi:hypothetical protein